MMHLGIQPENIFIENGYYRLGDFDWWARSRITMTSWRTNHSVLSPVLFEALLFLRSNRTLWDVRTVQRALLAIREDQKSDRLKKKLAEVAEADGEDEDGEDTDIEDEGE
jgi:hypothetical protein